MENMMLTLVNHRGTNQGNRECDAGSMQLHQEPRIIECGAGSG